MYLHTQGCSQCDRPRNIPCNESNSIKTVLAIVASPYRPYHNVVCTKRQKNLWTLQLTINSLNLIKWEQLASACKLQWCMYRNRLCDNHPLLYRLLKSTISSKIRINYELWSIFLENIVNSIQLYLYSSVVKFCKHSQMQISTTCMQFILSDTLVG